MIFSESAHLGYDLRCGAFYAVQSSLPMSRLGWSNKINEQKTDFCLDLSAQLG
jgi:hypothetical protein